MMQAGRKRPVRDGIVPHRCHVPGDENIHLIGLSHLSGWQLIGQEFKGWARGQDTEAGAEQNGQAGQYEKQAVFMAFVGREKTTKVVPTSAKLNYHVPA